MNRNEIFEKVKDIIAENLSVDDPDRITPETSLTKDLEAVKKRFGEFGAQKLSGVPEARYA